MSSSRRSSQPNATNTIVYVSPGSKLLRHIADALVGAEAQRAIDARHERQAQVKKRRRVVPEHIKRDIRFDADGGHDVMLLAYRYSLDPQEIKEIIKECTHKS